MNLKSSEPCEMGKSADAQSATTGAMAEEEEEVADDGKTVAFTRDGVTALARTIGRTSLARKAGGTSLVRATRTATQASLLCRHRQEGMTTTIRTRGLPGATHYRLHLGWRPGPSLAAYLQTVCS